MRNLNLFLTFFLVFLLSASLALAVDINIPKIDYSQGEVVIIQITDCQGDSIVRVSNPTQLVQIIQGVDNWNTEYNTNSDANNGKYAIDVTCRNGQVKKEFCVDANGCLAGAQPPAGGGVPPGGNGGPYCSAKWECGVWGYCDAALKQTRICNDLECNQKPKVEVRDCSECLESWTCSIWSDCQGDLQYRVCGDLHECGTFNRKPIEQKQCGQADYGFEPGEISNEIPPKTGQQPKKATTKATTASFWDQYGLYVMIGAIVVFLAALVLGILYLMKSKKRVVYNYGELKDWIIKERNMGTSDADIKKILIQQTGWKEEEVNEAFKELK